MLAEVLKINTGVTTLNISCNQIGDEGAQALIDCLFLNKTLQELDLSINSLSDSLKESINSEITSSRVKA